MEEELEDLEEAQEDGEAHLQRNSERPERKRERNATTDRNRTTSMEWDAVAAATARPEYPLMQKRLESPRILLDDA